MRRKGVVENVSLVHDALRDVRRPRDRTASFLFLRRRGGSDAAHAGVERTTTHKLQLYKLQLAHTETKLKSANEQLYRLRRKTSHGANDGSENVRDIYKQKEKEQSKEEQSVAIAKKNKEEPSIAITFCRLLFVWLTCWLVTSIVDGPSYY